MSWDITFLPKLEWDQGLWMDVKCDVFISVGGDSETQVSPGLSSGAWVPLPPWPHRSASLLLLHFLLTYQIEMGLLYKNLPENIMYERHTLHVFLF